jgi:hypothetical protein
LFSHIHLFKPSHDDDASWSTFLDGQLIHRESEI